MGDNKGIVWKWAVGLLVLCNIALMATIWLKPSQQQMQRPETPRDFVIRSVKLNDAQVQQYDVLIMAHRSAMDSLRREAMKCRQALFNNLKADGSTKLNPDSVANVISALQREIELVTYHHFEQVRMICTDAQKVDFDRVIGDVIRKMNGRPGPPPHDGQGPPPPDRGPHEGPPGEHDGPPPPDGPPR